LKKSIGESPLKSIAAFGTQSCGKSSTLNAMFDTDFAVSNNACTRGISIRLIPKSTVDGKEEFLLILDVEGIRSSEKYSRLNDQNGYEKAALNDNRLACLSIIPTDICLMLIKGEENESILENVCVAFYNHKMTVQNFIKKLQFVYINDSMCGRKDDQISAQSPFNQELKTSYPS